MAFSTLRIPSFRGLDASRGPFHPDPATSPDAVNILCRSGILSSARAPALLTAPPVGCVRLFEGFFAAGPALLAAGNGCVYAFINDVWQTLGSGFSSDDWCAVNYRKNDEDWLILVNGTDSMQSWDGTSASLAPIQTVMGGEDVRFERLTLIYERLWGAVTSAQPDRVYWSESFAPDNWELNYDVPEDGGGFIDVATFDGSRIRAVIAAFDDVLIVKDRSMHRLNGTYPGDFSLTQVYGVEGTLAARTLVQTADRLYFLGRDGLCVYDGMTVRSLTVAGDRRMKDVFARVNQEAVSSACASFCEGVIRIALPLDGSAVNTHVVEYSLADDTWALVACPGLLDWLLWRDGQQEKLLCLTASGLFEYGASAQAMGTARWVSPELCADRPPVRRRTHRVAFAIDAPAAGSLTLALTGELASGALTVSFAAGRTDIRTRLRARGRHIFFTLTSDSSFSLSNGLAIELENEPD